MGLVTRNITREPEVTLAALFRRHGIDLAALETLHRRIYGEVRG